MLRVYVANAQPEERAAFCLLLLDLKMKVVGESSDWPTTLAQAPDTQFNMLLVDADLLPSEFAMGIAELRRLCLYEFFVVLVSQLDARQQAAFSAGADDFISKTEVPKRMVDRLQLAAKSMRT